jgi:hypothetical protein
LRTVRVCRVTEEAAVAVSIGAAARARERQLHDVTPNVPVEITKTGQFRATVGDVAVISHAVSDNKPDPRRMKREKGKSRVAAGPWWKVRDEMVRLPTVTERSAIPVDKCVEETTGFVVAVSDEFRTTF